MVEIICSRSGLKFEAPNKRLKVHPEISWYTSHKNTDIRYPAIAVIERGKQEGWDSIEKFEIEIEKALNPEPPTRPDYDFEGAWVASIKGASEKYRLKREFLEEVDTEGRFKRFAIKDAGDGIYECCYKSSKGNETRRYYSVEGSKLTEIMLSKVEELYPVIEKPQPVEIEGCTLVKKQLGGVEEIVRHEGQIWKIVRAYSLLHWEDEDGICGTGAYKGDGYLVSEHYEYSTYLRPANTEEIEAFEEKQVFTKRVQKAKARLHEIDCSISVQTGAISPESASYPSGVEIAVETGYFQLKKVLIMTDTELWSLLYNGSYSDDWSVNNVASQWVGCYVPLTPQLRTELEEIQNIILEEPA